MILAKYGVALTIQFPMIKRGAVDFALSGDWTPAAGDAKISKDAGDVASTTNTPAIEGGTGAAVWALTLTAAEMQAARITIQIVDSATKAVEDQCFQIETYGDASAAHPFDLGTAVPKVDLETIKTQAITCAAGVTVGAYVGNATHVIAVDANGYVTYANTAPPSAAAISSQVASDLATAHGAGAWTTATGFSTHSASDVWAVETRTLTSAGSGGATAQEVWEYATRTLTSLGTGSGLTAIPWNSDWDSEVQSECADALAAYDAPTNAEMEARTLVAAGYATAANVTDARDAIQTQIGTSGAGLTAVKLAADGLPDPAPEGYGADLTEEQITSLAGQVADAMPPSGFTDDDRATLNALETFQQTVYQVHAARAGEAPRVDLVAYQRARIGPIDIVAEDSQANGTFRLSVYDLAAPSTEVWSLTNSVTLGEDNLTLTILDDDTHTDNSGVWGYVLKNTTTDGVISEGSLTIKGAP